MSKRRTQLEDFPLRLKIQDIMEIMAIGRKLAYQIVNRDDFPKVKAGNCFIIPRDAFFRWYNSEFINGT